MSMEQPPRDPIYQFLTPDPDKEILSGNFHKIITNKKGQPVAFFHNGTLVDGAYKA
jgi:glutathione peroxidase-family protein